VGVWPIVTRPCQGLGRRDKSAAVRGAETLGWTGSTRSVSTRRAASAYLHDDLDRPNTFFPQRRSLCASGSGNLFDYVQRMGAGYGPSGAGRLPPRARGPPGPERLRRRTRAGPPDRRDRRDGLRRCSWCSKSRAILAVLPARKRGVDSCALRTALPSSLVCPSPNRLPPAA